MKYTISILIVAFCALALVSSGAFADGPSKGQCNPMAKHGGVWNKKDSCEVFFHKTRMILKNAAELGLSEDQISKIKALKYNVEKSSIKEDADIKSIALDIREAIRKDDVDANAVNSLIDKKYALKAQKAKDDVEAYVSLKKILTSDQQKKLKEIWSSGMMNGKKHWKAEEEKE